MENEIEIKKLIQIFIDRKIGIIIIILLCTILGFVYTTYFVSPVYQATATAILTSNAETDDGNGSLTQTEVNLNNSLLSTYSSIATSDTVISTVIRNLGLSVENIEGFKKNISVTSETNNQVIRISVENDNPELAAKIANEIRTVFSQKVTELYDMENIKPLDDAKVPNEPSNINHIRDIIMFFAIGIVVAAIYAIIANLLDNTVKSSSDIEKAIGINVIAEIPVYEYSKGRKR